MLCEKCKIREANIKYMEVINGIKTEHNFCSQCAQEVDFSHYSNIFDGELPLGKLLSGLLGVEENHQKENKFQKITCPTCKTTYNEFIKNSCFGCSDCYGVFDVLIQDSIKQLHGNDSHTGKKPKYQKRRQESPGFELKPDENSVEARIEELDSKLRAALKKEEYEIAAQCRDKIKQLKEGKDSNA